MTTPSNYYSLHEDYERVTTLALALLMSDEIPSIEGKYASALFDEVGDINLDDPEHKRWLP